MWYIGIDPGKSGAAVFLDGSEVLEFRFSKYSHEQIAHEVRLRDEQIGFAYIEKPGFMPTDGRKSVREVALSLGFFRGVFEGLVLPYELVTPKKWQAPLGLVRKHESYQAKKRAHKRKAEEEFPDEKIVLESCDAYLLASVCQEEKGYDHIG